MKKLTAIMAVIILALCLCCGLDDGNDSRPDTSRVTLHLGNPSSGKLGAQAIPSAVSKIRITVSGSGMTTIEKTIDVAGQTTITATLDVPTGQERTFLVEALDSTGAVLYNGSKTADLTGTAVTLDIALADFMPTGLSARAFSSMRIDLSWTVSTDLTGADGYNIYNSGVKIATVTATSYSHTGLSANTQYCYTVFALNAAGNESLQSSESCATTSPAAFSKTFGGMDGSHEDSSIDQTSDGGYILAGRTTSSYDVWVLKLNPDGTVAWQKTYGDTGSDVANSIHQTSDGGYILAGQTTSFGAGSNDYWVLKLNPDGTVAWQKTYGGTSSDIANSIQQTTDGGYIVGGYSSSFGAGSNDAWVLKLNPDGTVAWQKTYGGTGGDVSYSVQQTPDGGYIAGGSSNSFGAGNGEAWILKLNPDGTVAWQKTYGETGWDYADSVQQTADGGYIVGGSSSSFGAGNYDYWVLKLDPDGTVAWQKTYGGTGGEYVYSNSIHQTLDGGYILAGETTSFGAGGSDAWVLKLNPDGTVAWQKTYGLAWDDWVFSVKQTSDGFIMAGGTCPPGGTCDLWVMKTNPDGAIGCGMSADQSIAPLDTTATVTDTLSIPGDSSPTVYDTSVTPQDMAATVDTQCSEATGGPSRMLISSMVFPDANLSSCINTDAASQGYYYADQITSLKCSSRGIADITGIEWFTSLTTLWLYSNSISDISALSGLTNLTELLIYNNSISDISALSGLTNLTNLQIFSNSISDVSALSGLTNLTLLCLCSNSISDISALSGLTNLTDLYLYDNSISDVSALSGLTSMVRLYLDNNIITQGVATLTGMTSATQIDLRGNTSIPCADLAILEAALPGVVRPPVSCL
jgi:uncharacterized delta-60 repeat protein